MSDQASTPTGPALDRWYFDFMGKQAMAMDPRPRLKRFAVHDGDRRRLADRSPGAANLVCIPNKKENA
jgi:hypothetical protein